MDLEDHYKIKY